MYSCCVNVTRSKHVTVGSLKEIAMYCRLLKLYKPYIKGRPAPNTSMPTYIISKHNKLANMQPVCRGDLPKRCVQRARGVVNNSFKTYVFKEGFGLHFLTF